MKGVNLLRRVEADTDVLVAALHRIAECGCAGGLDDCPACIAMQALRLTVGWPGDTPEDFAEYPHPYNPNQLFYDLDDPHFRWLGHLPVRAYNALRLSGFDLRKRAIRLTDSRDLRMVRGIGVGTIADVRVAIADDDIEDQREWGGAA